MAGRAATPRGRKLNNVNNMPDIPAKYKLLCTFYKVKLAIDWTTYVYRILTWIPDLIFKYQNTMNAW
jgi:hypothetical protein